MNKTIKSIQGSLIRKAKELARPTSIDFGLGQINFAPEISTIDAAQVAAGTIANYGYTPTMGNERLRELVIENYNESNGVRFDSNNVLVTAGATGAITATFMALLGEDRDNVVVPEIHYPTYSLVPGMIGQGKYEVKGLKLDADFTPNLSDLEEKLNKRSIIVLNYPSNPTGAVVSPDKLEDIATIAQQKKALIISDEVYSEIYFGERPESIAKYAPATTVVVNSLSKSGLVPGLRIGWAVAPNDIIPEITKAHQFMNSCVSSVSQAAAESVLKNPEQFGDLRNKLRGNQKELVDFFARKGVKINSDGGIYVFADVSEYGESLDVARDILEKVDVVSVPGAAFGEAAKNYLRFSFGVDEKTLREGIKRLDDFF